MSYIITEKNEVFVDFQLEDGAPVWTVRSNADCDARRFITKEEAISVRDELRALGLNPKIVDWQKRAEKQNVIPFKREVAPA